MNLRALSMAAVSALVLSVGVAPATADENKDESGKGKQGAKSQRPHADRGDYFHREGYSNLGIPDGHLPPPGECRIWYPGRPPGQQPPPVKCDRLSGGVPGGAWLMQRPVRAPKHVEVTVYDERRPGVVVDVGIFDARTGSFIRIGGSK